MTKEFEIVEGPAEMEAGQTQMNHHCAECGAFEYDCTCEPEDNDFEYCVECGDYKLVIDCGQGAGLCTPIVWTKFSCGHTKMEGDELED